MYAPHVLDEVCKDWGCCVCTQASTATTNFQEAGHHLLKSRGGDANTMQSVVPKACPLSGSVRGIRGISKP